MSTNHRIALLTSLALTLPCFAQDDEPAVKPADVEAASLPLRTALYHAPTLAPPLERLLKIYREAGRSKELVETYRQHVAQYPADAGALIVLVRLLDATNDAEAGRIAASAVARFPDNAYLRFLHFEHLQQTHEPGALDALDQAIAKETLPARKRAWIEELIPIAIAEGRPEIAQRHLENLANETPTADGKLDIARKMIAQKFYAPALATIDAAAAQKPSAETGVDLDLAAASAELGLQREPAATARLDRLLARLAADYWRRTEILHRRTALVKTDADREAMLAGARARAKAAPGDESAVLELTQLLAAFEFRREALEALLAAARRLPASEKIEKAALELFDLLRDERGRETFLAERLRAAPDRQDLALAHARSLFLLARRSEALAVFDGLAAKLDPAARLTQLLELARFLRRSSLHADAAELFTRALALAPARLDVRRELAETWLAIGRKEKAREVFAGKMSDDTETENLLDVIQFFLKQEMFAEARATLAERVAKEPQNFDLRLMQLTVATRLADRAAGEKVIEETRGLADTDARYRRWLEGAVAFHEAFESEAAFLDAAQQRVLATPGGWAGENRERRLVFADVAAAHGRKAEVAAMIDGALAGELPVELKVELRRRQLALVENDPAQAAATEEQLKALMKDDPEREADYRIRLALLASRQKREDQAARYFNPGDRTGIDVKKVNDVALLTGYENLLRQRGGGDPKSIFDILERVTVLEPANRGAWERWITALATNGDEEKLRAALRQLLAGVDRMPLSDETRGLLKSHLLASHWRSMSELVRDDDAARLSEALPLLDAASRLAEKREEWLWIAWTRAYLLNRLNQRDARDEAIRELERVTALPEKSEEKNTIAFPDGLVIALDQARELLTTPPRSAPPAKTQSGPRGTLKVRWAFDADRRAPISKVLPLDAARVLVIDNAGRLYCIETATGKLRWSREGPRPLTPMRNDYNVQTSAGSDAVPAIDGGRIFLPTREGIECWSGDDGRLLWRADAEGEPGMYPSLFVHAGRVLVCEPAKARITALQTETGKVQWEREYPRPKTAQPVNALNSGASFSEGRVLLYGMATLIVNAANGDVMWSFDTTRAANFPIPLAETAAPTPTPFAMPATYWRGSYNRTQNFFALDYLMRQQFARSGWTPQTGQQFALAYSAAAWATSAGSDGRQRFAVLDGPNLLLFSDNGLRTVRLDLPFAGKQISTHGAFIGIAGRFASMLSGGVVNVVDLESGLDQTFQTSPNADTGDGDGEDDPPVRLGRQPDPFLHAALDGLVVYLSQRSGVSAYHARTQQRLLDFPWPKNLEPRAATAVVNESVNYFPQGRMRYINGQYGAVERVTALVADGVLYTEVVPGRLVALTGGEEK